MWAEFKIYLQEDDSDINGLFSLGMIDCTDLKRFYASKDNKGRSIVMLIFDGYDEEHAPESLVVYDTYKEVKSKLKSLMKQHEDSRTSD